MKGFLKMNVLIVESDEAMRKYLAKFVSESLPEKPVVQFFENGLDALTHCKEQAEKPGLILSAVGSRLDGVELLMGLRNSVEPALKSVPLIFVTGSLQINEKEAQRLGANAYVEKPFKREQIVEAINTALGPKHPWPFSGGGAVPVCDKWS